MYCSFRALLGHVDRLKFKLPTLDDPIRTRLQLFFFQVLLAVVCWLLAVGCHCRRRGRRRRHLRRELS